MRGDAAGALERFGDAVRARAPTRWPSSQDLLEISHWLSPAQGGAGRGVQPGHRRRSDRRARARDGRGAVAAACWRGPGRCCSRASTRSAPPPMRAAAAEMLLLRLACVSDLPSPAELARLLAAGDGRRPAPRPTPMPQRRCPGRHRGGAAGAAGCRRSATGREPSLPTRAGGAARQARRPSAELVELSLRDGGEAPLAAWLSQSAPPDPFRAGPARAALRARACRPTSPAGSARRRRAYRPALDRRRRQRRRASRRWPSRRRPTKRGAAGRAGAHDPGAAGGAWRPSRAPPSSTSRPRSE